MREGGVISCSSHFGFTVSLAAAATIRWNYEAGQQFDSRNYFLLYSTLLAAILARNEQKFLFIFSMNYGIGGYLLCLWRYCFAHSDVTFFPKF